MENENPNNTPSPVFNVQQRRHLSKGMRITNFFYKLLLALLSAVNFSLMLLDANVKKVHIPEAYFEVMSVCIAIVPVFWSALLDSCKTIDITVPNSPNVQK